MPRDLRRERKERERRSGEKKEIRPVYTAVYKVNRSDTLLEFLLRKAGTSRNNVKSLLTRRQVLVNGSLVTQYDFPLAKDDEVKISKTSLRAGVEKSAPTDRKRSGVKERTENKEIKIVYEDDDFLAVDKPCGLLSVESDKERESAFSYAFEYLKKQGKNARPYVLHRIDKETSGVLVFAKNPKIQSKLKLQWNEKISLREYVALVEGKPEKSEDTIVSYLKENKNNLMYSTSDPTGQKAITRYKVEKTDGEYSLLNVQIETGRKNQIRVHMQKIGCPVVFDEKYGYTKNPIKRLGLHASKLEFFHPETGELISVCAPTPSVFYTVVKSK
ncbi:MAG: RluA family pseudouridine synthase [Clostridia bacterium]|nr:RluA family pseudouridine synthase [Clostridia bacterium]